MRLKPGARPARALPMGVKMHIRGRMQNNGWVALSVLQNGGEKRRLSGADRTGPRIPIESIRLRWDDAIETGGTPGPGAAGGRSEAHPRAHAEQRIQRIQRMGGAEGAPKWWRKTPAVTGGPHRTPDSN